MDASLISVILPTYNHESYVQAAIDSVLAQRDVDLELLVEDDGSRDRTADVVEAIRDPRLHFVRKARNEGAPTTFRNLMARARGAYVATISSDDVWVGTDKLARQLQVLREQPQVGACFGWAGYIDEKGRPVPKDRVFAGGIFEQPNRTSALWLRRFFDGGNCLCHPTILIRRSCYEEVGLYDNRLRQIPDYALWIKLLKRHEIHVLPRELILFRVLGEDNASAPTVANTTRLRNEEYFIQDAFFDGMGRDQLLAGFGDLLVNPDPRTPEELEIEKALLFFKGRAEMQATYWMIGLRKIFGFLALPQYRSVLADYGIDDAWLHERMAIFSPFHVTSGTVPAGSAPAPEPGQRGPQEAGRPSAGSPLLRYLSFLRR